MDNVQEINHCINMQSSQIYTYYLASTLADLCNNC
jgi:hypothetical protein